MLADALPKLALPLVNLVRSYMVFPSASLAAKPTLVTAFSKDLSWFSAVSGIACSPDQRTIWVTVSATTKAWLLIFSGDGQFLRFASRGQWNSPEGLSFTADGDAFVADSGANSVYRCRSDGSILRRFGSLGGRALHFKAPCGVAIDRESLEDRVFVCDAGNDRIQVLQQQDGKVIKMFGTTGTDDGQFKNMHAIAAFAGELAVADLSNGRIQVCVCDRGVGLTVCCRYLITVASFCARSVRKFERTGMVMLFAKTVV